MSSLAYRFSSAVQWNAATAAATVVIQFSITAVLARLLTPSDFGIFAIANVVFAFAVNLGQAGMMTAIVREPILDREVVGAVVGLSIAVSLLLAVAVFILAPLIARGGDEADQALIGHLVRIMSVTVLMSGLALPAQAIMSRELRYRELKLAQLAGILLGTGGTTIFLAIRGNGAWSLAVGYLVNMLVVCLSCWWRVRDRWAISWVTSHIVRIGGVGAKLTFLYFLDLIWKQLPLIASYLRFPASEVGIYQRSQATVDLGIQSTIGGLNIVFFSAVSSKQNRSYALKSFIPPLISLYSLFLLPTTVFVANMAPEIVRIVLGEQWSAAAPIMALVMIAFAAMVMSQPMNSGLELNAYLGPRLVGAAVSILVLGILSLMLVGQYGTRGIAMAAIVSGLCASLINFAAGFWLLDIDFRKALNRFLPGVGVSAIVECGLLAYRELILIYVENSVARFLSASAVSAVCFVIGFRLFVRGSNNGELSARLSPETSRIVLEAAKILGLRVPTR